MQEEETGAEQSGGAPAQDNAAMQILKRLDEMSRLIEQQAQRAEEQQKRMQEQQALIAQLRALPARSPDSCASTSLQRSPHQETHSIRFAAAVAAEEEAAHAAPQSRRTCRSMTARPARSWKTG